MTETCEHDYRLWIECSQSDIARCCKCGHTERVTQERGRELLHDELWRAKDESRRLRALNAELVGWIESPEFGCVEVMDIARALAFCDTMQRAKSASIVPPPTKPA